MRAIFGLIFALGGLWLMWLVLMQLPFPWESAQAGAGANLNKTSLTRNSQQSTIAPLGTGTPGANPGGIGWSFAT